MTQRKVATPMKVITTNFREVYCGIDFHKNTSTLCAKTKDGTVVEKTTIKTSLLVKYLASRKIWKIGIEATGGVNHVVDEIKKLGHTVTIINSNKFRGIGIGGKKTDNRDAEALCDVLRLDYAPAVFHRSLYARQIKSLLTTREHLVKARVDGMNHVRGTLREYGVTMPASAETFYKEAKEKIETLENGLIRSSLLLIFENIIKFKKQEEFVESQALELTKNDERVKRLQTVPGIGPMIAMTMVAVIDVIGRFPNAKEFASYLGLVPSIHGSADITMMGSITRSGCEMLRRYLIHGARSWMRYSPDKDSNRRWAENIKERRGMNKATVALAHRMARISFAILRDGTVYKNSKKKSRETKVAA
jgi:transposase